MKKLLVANRGEIAVRVIRAAQEHGLKTVAVASEADRNSKHVRLADEFVLLGPPEAAQSYLNIPKVLSAAAETGADAIHPGYGFLSERAELAEACVAAGITFVGPSGAAMRRLGSKIGAKTIAVQAEVPVVPGFFRDGATEAELLEAANSIGYPVLLKASAGGGGRGMRRVGSAAEFHDAFQLAQDEANNAFGDPAMMVEKLIERPRHIEVQFLADAAGNVAPLFERECSLQRRHQKLIEEAPSSRAETPWWEAMAAATRRLVRAAEYVNAGTVEFIVDDATGGFYFLEVNARLQVEHPVTEMITGLDLVRWQLKIAAGELLDIPEDLVLGNRAAIKNHSIEARLVAEDPSKQFRPSVGKILFWNPPTGPGVRVDSGIDTGTEVSPYYDSLLAKVIATGETREIARQKLVAALRETHLLGLKTNLAFLIDLVDSEAFASGRFHTGTVAEFLDEWSAPPVPPEIGLLVGKATTAAAGPASQKQKQGAWDLADGFRNVRA